MKEFPFRENGFCRNFLLRSVTLTKYEKYGAFHASMNNNIDNNSINLKDYATSHNTFLVQDEYILKIRTKEIGTVYFQRGKSFHWSRLFRDKTGQGERGSEGADSLIISFTPSGGPRTTRGGRRVGRTPTCFPTFKKCPIL